MTDRTDSLPDDVILALNRQAIGAVVRDDATLEHHRRLGIDRVTLGGCPTLLLEEVLEPATVPRRGALLSVRAPELMSVPLRDQRRVAGDVAGIVDQLQRAGHEPVRLLCHDRRDVAFVSSLGVAPYVVPDDLEMYLSLLRSAELVVTFRLHAFVPCVSLGTPAVNLSYDERSSSLVRTMGLADWDIAYIDANDPVAAVADRLERLDDLGEALANAHPTREMLRKELLAALDGFADAARHYARTEGPPI